MHSHVNIGQRADATQGYIVVSPLLSCFPVLVLALLLCVQLPSSAVSVNGSLTSVAWARENRLENAAEAETNLLFYEYLRLHATNLGSDRLTAHLSGRVGWDRLESFGEKYTARLYQGYLNWRLSNRANLSLGRQFLPNDVGFWQMDGIQFELRRSGFLSPAFYGGIAVLPWTIEGDNEAILGIELKTRRLKRVRSKFSFFTVFDSDEEVTRIQGLDKAIVGLQFDTFDWGILDSHKSLFQRLNISGRTSVDVLAKQFIGGCASASFHILPKGQLYAEYRQETPLFPADSIFAVFALEPLSRLAIGLDYEAMSFLGLHGRYSRQFFDSGPVDRYSAGFTLRSERETFFALRLEHLDDMDTHYWRVYSHVGKQLARRLEIGINNYYNNYRFARKSQTEDAYSFQLRIGYRLSKNLQAIIRLEDNINPDYKYNIRARGYVRMGFGFGK